MISLFNTVIIDNQFVFRIGLRKFLADYHEINIIADLNTHEEISSFHIAQRIDLVLFNAKIPITANDFFLSLIKQENPNVKAIAFIACIDEDIITKMIDFGIDSFLIKDISKDELATAIRTTLAGKNYFSKEIVQIMSKRFGKSYVEEPNIEENIDKIKLSKREVEILNLICTGLSNSEIAEKLFISQRTVDSHRAKILAKTGTKNTANLLMYAVRNKLVDIKD